MSQSSKDKMQKFEELPNDAARRVAIARDVIAQLSVGKFSAMEGFYANLYPTGVDDWTSTTLRACNIKSDEFSDAVETEVGVCRVCAIGAMFISAVTLYDRFKSREYEALQSTLTRYLGKWFDRMQLGLVECAFERVESFNKGSNEQGRDAVCFGFRYERLDERLAAIMQNIINNEGTFVPEINA